MQNRFEEKSRTLEASTSKALSLEVKTAQLTDQLLTLQLTARSGFDERMEKELLRLKEESKRELDSIKGNTLYTLYTLHTHYIHTIHTIHSIHTTYTLHTHYTHYIHTIHTIHTTYTLHTT